MSDRTVPEGWKGDISFTDVKGPDGADLAGATIEVRIFNKNSAEERVIASYDNWQYEEVFTARGDLSEATPGAYRMETVATGAPDSPQVLDERGLTIRSKQSI